MNLLKNTRQEGYTCRISGSIKSNGVSCIILVLRVYREVILVFSTHNLDFSENSAVYFYRRLIKTCLCNNDIF